MRLIFIVNPNSDRGKGLKIWNRACNYLSRHGHEYEIFYTAALGDGAGIARMLTEELQSEDEQLSIVVIGDDPTLNEVVNGLHHLAWVKLGFIPTSPKDGYARSLHLSGNPRRVISRFESLSGVGRVDVMDYGVLTCENGEIIRRFVGSSGVGFGAELCRKIEHMHNAVNRIQAIRPRKLIRFHELFNGVLFTRPIKGYIVLDGERRVEFNNLLQISVHIHPYEGKYKIGSYADPKDGMLEICAINCRNRFKFTELLIKSRVRGLNSSSRAKMFQCKEAHIHFDKQVAVHTDGAYVTYGTDFDFRCVQQQLNLYR